MESTPPPVQLLRPDSMYRAAAFSQVAVVPPGAWTVYVGGQNAVDDQGRLVGGTDVAAQTAQVMLNLHRALTAAGASESDLISLTILLVSGVDVRAAYAAAAASLAHNDTPPLVGLAIVSGLAMPGAQIEVSAVAAVLR
jgi:enamine deaminase RidA (YjgF/YER057c/UK114 family)